MGAVRYASFARRVSDVIAGGDLCPYGYPSLGINVHVKHRPSRLLYSVAIQVFNHLAVVRADDQSRRDSHHPGFTQHAAHWFTRWGKIESRPGRA